MLLFWPIIVHLWHLQVALVEGADQGFPESAKCHSDEINHSVLFECNSPTGCSDSQEFQDLDVGGNGVNLIYSARSGARFRRRDLDRLHYKESDEQRMFDINTTLYVSTEAPKAPKITGVGPTIDLRKLDLLSSESVNWGRPILEDALGISRGGIGSSLLRLNLTVEADSVLYFRRSLKKFDEIAADLRVNGTKPIYFILDLSTVVPRTISNHVMVDLVDTMKELFILKCYAIAIDSEGIVDDNRSWIEGLRAVFKDAKLLVTVKASDSPQVMDRLMDPEWPRWDFDGLLLKSEPSTPYTIHNTLRSRYHGIELFAVGREKPVASMYGNWQSAQNLGAELLNHLKHGMNGFLDSGNFFENILESSTSSDCSIYNLRKSHGLHFRGPVYYAIGHFSRFVHPGSARLSAELFTQPNMFAAHYIAFKTPDNLLVVIVLNDNEHLLPFRLSVDGFIEAQTMLEPKSFNTIQLKL